MSICDEEHQQVEGWEERRGEERRGWKMDLTAQWRLQMPSLQIKTKRQPKNSARNPVFLFRVLPTCSPLNFSLAFVLSSFARSLKLSASFIAACPSIHFLYPLCWRRTVEFLESFGREDCRVKRSGIKFTIQPFVGIVYTSFFWTEFIEIYFLSR